METLRAIDMWAPIPPVEAVFRHAAEHFPKEMLGYLRVFYKEQATLETWRRRANADGDERVFGQSTVADKVLFGSGWFLLGRPLAEIVAEFRALPVKPAVLEKWLRGNAAALLGGLG